MIAVDSSVWIDYFNGHTTPQTDRLHAALGEQPIVVGDLVLTEVLQGFRSEARFRRAHRLLAAFPAVSMVGPTLAIRAARNYRALRAAGVTVRKTIDVMIGTYCIETNLPLLYSDRDFDPMVEHLGLKRA
ncbi:MAG: PIN domain nuclease [Deltaproteobacteria bacterium]|nr:PIN domain nuclease [Deltaproteobacteria bacterium]